jgi:sulfide dehydrogenase cytochrome subunit
MRAMTLALTTLAANPAASQAPLVAQGCLGCHGAAGEGAGAIAALSGRPEAELLAALRGFRDGKRPGTIMGRIASGYSDAELRATAAWFASQPGTRP